MGPHLHTFFNWLRQVSKSLVTQYLASLAAFEGEAPTSEQTLIEGQPDSEIVHKRLTDGGRRMHEIGSYVVTNRHVTCTHIDMTRQKRAGTSARPGRAKTGAHNHTNIHIHIYIHIHIHIRMRMYTYIYILRYC